MPPRTTLGDRARKARIRERDYRRVMWQMRSLETISEAQKATLNRLVAANVRGEEIKATSIPDWPELHKMGIVKEVNGNLIVTSIGTEVAAALSK